ncbi:TolA colicin import membrane protein [Legionella busanensis]|uniref:TolA colicin import membrane protein n=1 Tax=Legionella busanensis TaxID=190655 RepID=A0A378JKW2_9GAMM|nr:cell envelope integrity protein TolA [Legionella busanensis]STX51717.1 TolA colicin import membrane protein [Legionella busanensis]
MIDNSYRKSFFIALFLHLVLGILLFTESMSSRPVLVKETENKPGQIITAEVADQPKPEIVKAVSVDSKEVMDTVNHLKEERVKQQKAEQDRQLELKKQAEAARKARLQEQQRLAKLKEEAAKLALAKKKAIEEEQKRLKQLALQREQETKRLEDLKNKQKQLEQKQRQEAEKLALLKQEEQINLARAEQEKKEKEELEKEAKAQAERYRAEQAAKEAADKAKIAGEVNKYKAMIINAISQQWILPENVNDNLSSQFRIRLAPSGEVLEVSLIRSSGDPILDRSAQTAIYKASPLPVPTDPTTFDLFRDISLTVRPENVRG